MSLKKTVALVLFCVMMCTMLGIPALASERITEVVYEVNDEFNNYTGGIPEGWTAYGVWDAGTEEAFSPMLESCSGKRGEGVKITLKDGQYAAGIAKDVVEPLDKNTYLEVAFDVKTEADTVYPMIRLADASNGELARIVFVNGMIKTSDNAVKDDRAVIGTYQYTPGEWFHVRLRIDGYNGTYSVWVNGKKSVNQQVYAWDGGLVHSGYNGLTDDTKKQTFLSEAQNILLGVYETGVCSFDNASIVRYTRETNAGTSVFSTDFSDLEEGYGQVPTGFILPSRYWGVGGAKFDAEHGNVLELCADHKAGIVYKLDSAATSGTVTFDFDVYKTGTSWNTPLSIVGYATDVANSIKNEWESVWILKDGNERLELGETALNSWMHYQIVVDMDAKKSTVYCDGKQVGLGGLSEVWGKSKFGALRLSAYDLTGDSPAEIGNVIYLDNFRCVVSSSVQNKDVSDSFTYSDIDELKKNWGVTQEGAGIIRFENDDLNSWVTLDNTGVSGAKAVLQKTLVTPINEGIIRIEYGIKRTGNASIAAVAADDGNGKNEWKNLPVAVLDTDANGNCSLGIADYWATTNKICEIKSDTWYDIAAEIDLISSEITVSAVERGSEVEKKSTVQMENINEGYRVKNLKWFKFQQTEAGQEGTISVDYFNARQTVPSPHTPVVNFYGCNGEVYNMADEMNPGISEISLDFGTAMDINSVLEAVSLIDQNGEPVEFIPLINGMSTKLLLVQLLKPNHNYRLQIKGGVKNTSGTILGMDSVTDFSTGFGGLYVKKFAMQTEHMDITNLNQLNTDTWTEFSGTYVNTLEKGRELRLILSYYKNNHLIDTEYQPVYFGEDIRFANFRYLKRIKAAGESDTVKVFLWNGEKYMHPLVKNLEVK